MTVLDGDGTHVIRPSRAHLPTTAKERRSTWQQAALKTAQAFLVLTGITIGTLALRYVLILLHGALQ
jgi:hypothetical protein